MNTEYFDTKTLTVGQRIIIRSGYCSTFGTVTEVGPWGACMQPHNTSWDPIYFSRQGIGLNNHVYETGRWELAEVETPQGWKKVSILSSEDYIASLPTTTRPQLNNVSWLRKLIVALIGE